MYKKPKTLGYMVGVRRSKKGGLCPGLVIENQSLIVRFFKFWFLSLSPFPHLGLF